MKNIIFFCCFFFVGCINTEQKKIQLINNLKNDIANDTTFFIEPAKAEELRDLYMLFVDEYPISLNAPQFLCDAAKMSAHTHDWYKAIGLYEKVITEYPDSDLAAQALFTKAFILDENLNQDNKAEMLYNLFLKRYPNHELTASVVELIDILYMSEEELLARYNKKR